MTKSNKSVKTFVFYNVDGYNMNKSEIYERKKAYAKRKMAENAKIESLNEEQHAFLESFCSFRHEYHCNMERWFNSGVTHSCKLVTDDFETDLFDIDFIYYLNQELKRLDLPKFTANIDIVTIPDDTWIYDEIELDSDDDGYDEAYQNAYDNLFDEAMDVYNKFHNELENYLLNIDKKHGTKYCPTGFSRL